MIDIIVAGWQKSGNTWLSRLMGDVLNSPVTGFKNAKPIAIEGLDRDGAYTVRQLHAKPVVHMKAKRGLVTPYLFAINKRTPTEYVIHIQRDPRDVAVSAHFYWQRDNLADTIERMATGKTPFVMVGPWSALNEQWNSLFAPYIYHTTYEQLIADPVATIQSICDQYGITPAIPIEEAVERQSFATKRAQLEIDGDERQWGKDVQLRNLRKGIVGDWRNHFDAECVRLAHRYWQNDLLIYGYESDESWVHPWL